MRGFWYMIEAVLVSVIVITFLMIVNQSYVSVIQPENLAEKGYLIMEGLDNRGELRNYTVAMDYEGLNDIIPVYNYNHTVQICNYDEVCAGAKPNASSIWTANYIIAGHDSFQPFIIRIYFSPL